jgi:Zn-dependent peptidase ImmA (M78 family)/DNA-binding XRE family transcriptional regulator
MFYSARLRLARFRAGLTKSQLAEAAGVSRVTIHKYENDQADPKPENISTLARCLNYPEQFFFDGPVDEPNLETASFRAMSHMLARSRDAALAAGSLAFLLGDWVETLFDLPEPRLLDLGQEKSPDHAARSLREFWGLGNRPIKNMVHLLEANGIRVFSLVEETRSVDAFSLWRNQKAYVFLNTVKTPEHSRFDAAHELGHLVLHKSGEIGSRKVEEEANRFASSFLMPSEDVRATLPYVYDIDQIKRTKFRWRVSAMALAYRLNKLECVSEWQYRQFCIQLSQQGFRTSEPGGIEREQSIVWEKVFNGLRSEKITKNDISSALNIPVPEIEKLVFGLANMISVDGGASGSGKPRGNLTLVS